MNENKVIEFELISNLKRSELESSYHVIQNENYQLKKALEHQLNETNRLSRQLLEVLHILNCKKLLKPSSTNSEKGVDLQLYVTILNEKVSVLTHQLLNHSRFHTEVHKCYRGITPDTPTTGAFMEEKKTSKKNYISSSNEAAQEKKIDVKKNEEMASIKNNYENEGNDEAIQVADNIDTIRLKILIKRLTVQNASLAHHVDSADKETTTLKKELDGVQMELEQLSNQVKKDKDKYSSIQKISVELVSLKQANKILQEEIMEIKEEKEALKDVNRKLLEELNDFHDKVNVS